MNNSVTYLTKFFEAESLNYFNVGSLRFGSLEYYAAEENRATQGARLDTGEGSYVTNIDHDGSWLSDIDFMGIKADKTSRISIKGGTISGRQNAHVLCTSLGPYSIKLHRSILCPSKNGYEGNANLVGYVTFDGQKLLTALITIACREYGLSEKSVGSWTRNGPVQYGDREKTSKLWSGKRGMDWDPVFTKPPLFAPENEHRITLNKDYPRYPERGLNGFNLVGPEILDAMIFQPRLISLEERDVWLRSSPNY